MIKKGQINEKAKNGLRKYLEKVKSGEIVKVKIIRPSMVKAIKEKCKDCMSGFVDGRLDCEIPVCSLYYWQPYGQLKKNRSKRKEEVNAKS